MKKPFDEESYQIGFKQGKESALDEAIAIFKKFKNEPMTGNVVILELEGLKNEE